MLFDCGRDISSGVVREGPGSVGHVPKRERPPFGELRERIIKP